MGNVAEVATIAMQNLHLVRIIYSDRHGAITERVCEPYSFRDELQGRVLYVHCLLRDGTRKFYIDNIVELEELDEEFIPRYAVEPGG